MKYTLEGVDGNAFAIMAYVKRAMTNENFTKDEIQSYMSEAMSSDYNNLLGVSLERIAECNGEVPEAVELEEDW